MYHVKCKLYPATSRRGAGGGQTPPIGPAYLEESGTWSVPRQPRRAAGDCTTSARREAPPVARRRLHKLGEARGAAGRARVRTRSRAVDARQAPTPARHGQHTPNTLACAVDGSHARHDDTLPYISPYFEMRAISNIDSNASESQGPILAGAPPPRNPPWSRSRPTTYTRADGARALRDHNDGSDGRHCPRVVPTYHAVGTGADRAIARHFS